MTTFEWLESFELGCEEIDDDHRQMLALMKRIQAAGETGDLQLSANLLDSLLSLAQSHFDREETFLEGIGYPMASVHKDYHARLLLRANAVKDACKAITSPDVFKQCCEEMFGFLIDDVVAGDLKIKSYLQEIGLTPGR